MAYAVDLLEMRSMKLRVDHLGYTREADDGRVVEVAMGWKDLEGYDDHVLGKLLGETAALAR